MKILINDVFKVEALPDHQTVRLVMKNANDGKEVELTISMQMLSEAASFAQKKQLNKYHTEQHGGDAVKQQWRETPLNDLHKWEVDEVPMFSPPAVALICDVGASYQLGYRMNAQVAEELGHALVSVGQRIQSQSAKGRGQKH